uniref:Cecropin-D n=1 Tax=Steinernema glaseri TaxID=37863 RepID=A0A1I7Z249_9BILA
MKFFILVLCLLAVVSSSAVPPKEESWAKELSPLGQQQGERPYASAQVPLRAVRQKRGSITRLIEVFKKIG